MRKCLEDLSSPNSQLTRIIEDSQKILAQSTKLLNSATAELIKTGNTDLIEEMLTERIKNADRSRIQLAWIKFIRGDIMGAREQYKKVLLNDPENEEALEGLAELEFESGDYVAAAQYFDELIDSCRSDSPPKIGLLTYALANRGTVARKLSKFKEAESFFRETELELTRNFSDRTFYTALAANDLGFYYFLTGKFGKAEKIFTLSLDFYKIPILNMVILIS